MKAVFTYDYGKEKMDAIRALGYDVHYIHESEIENSERIDSAEILVCYNPFRRLDLSRMKALKWIQLSSIGFDQLPEEALSGRDILVTNNRGGYSKPMGEWIVMNILEILKHRKAFYKAQQNRVWALDSGILELCGKRVGFLGTGTIAQEAAKRLSGFEADLWGFNTSGHETEHFHKCFALETLREHASLLDVLVVALPHTESTHHIVNRDLMDCMKDDAVLINVSRGGNIDEDALIEALKNDKFSGVALDVFEKEPLSEDSPLWEMERVYISPHNSWVSEMKNERRYALILENMRRYRAKEPLQNVIDIKRGY